MKMLLPIALENASLMKAILADLSSYCYVIGAVLLTVLIFRRRLSYRNENISFPEEVNTEEVEALSGSLERSA